MRERKIKQRLVICIGLFLLAVAIPLVSLFTELRPSSESLGIWFQRSGSIIVLLAVMIEFNLFKIGSELSSNGRVDNELHILIDKFSSLKVWFSFFSSVLVIIGTVIWGYGDLFIKYS